MKRLMSVAIIPLLTLMSCGSSQVSKENSAQQQQVADPATAVVTRLKDDKLNAVYEHYTLLAAALIKGDVKEARLAANAIEAGAGEVAGGEAMGANAAKIRATADVAAQRVAFSALSNEVISLVKKTGMSSGQLYVDFCPMAMNDKGAYWLSTDKTVQNPYFGEQMLTCGDVKETIQ